MATTRCKNGFRKCLSGKCARKKTTNSTRRCKKGSRKCVDQRCYKKKKYSTRSSYTLRNRVVK